MLELLIIVGVLLMAGGLVVNFIQKRKGDPK
jgi:hypothetical protein